MLPVGVLSMYRCKWTKVCGGKCSYSVKCSHLLVIWKFILSFNAKQQQTSVSLAIKELGLPWHNLLQTYIIWIN